MTDALGMRIEDWPTDGRHAMAVMGTEGDTKTIWDKNKPDEVEAARETFNKLTKKGYTAYLVTGKDGEKGEVMKTFDPNAERMILALPMRGG